jgi:hypothetical protein
VAEAAAGIRHKAGRLAGRAGWALADQAISSFTNFFEGVGAAQVNSVDRRSRYLGVASPTW